MILVATLCVAVVLRAALRLPLKEIGDIRIRGEKLLLTALVSSVLLPPLASRAGLVRSVTLVLWVGVIAVLLGCCALNWARGPGFVLLTVGVAANLVVIAANGGMPVSSLAATSLGAPRALAALGADMFHVLTRGDTTLAMFADVLPLPGMPGLRAVVSVGDVLMYVGIVVVLCGAPRSAATSSTRCAGSN